jgi:hypothetical protein
MCKPRIVSFQKVQKMEKCITPPSVHSNHKFSVFLATYESSYNIVNMQPNILKFGKCTNLDVLFHVTVNSIPVPYSFRKWLIVFTWWAACGVCQVLKWPLFLITWRIWWGKEGEGKGGVTNISKYKNTLHAK